MHKYTNRFFLLAGWLMFLVPVKAGAQNSTANGYKGIWFTLGQFSAYGDKYSGGLGTYTANHLPVAIYAPAVKKTFFVYGGTTRADEKHLLIMLSYYDHRHGVVPRPVIVYDKMGVNDPHDNASLSIDGQGFIWVFVSGRNTARPGLIFKSRQPYQVDFFDKVLEGEMTYPQPWWVAGKGFLYLFTKYTKGRELYFTTSADGKSWAPHQKLAGMGGHYQLSNRHQGNLVTVFNYHPGGNVDQRTNIYLLQTGDHGQTWKTIAGHPVALPVTDPQHEALVKDYQAEGKLVYLNDLNFDAAGNPVILAVLSRSAAPGPAGDPHEWVVIHWQKGSWQVHKVCESTHNYDMGSLYIGQDTWQIIGPTEPGPQPSGTGGEMALWVSKDEGRHWQKKRDITQNSARNHAYARRPLGAHPDFYAFWADGNAATFSESKLYFTNKKGNKVWELPYSMDNAFARPVRLKK
jgi:hypothetical protein